MNLRTSFQIFDFNGSKEKYLSENPLEKWLYVRRFNVFLMKLIGVEFMEPDYKFNWKTLIPMYLGLNFFCLMLYTCYYFRDEPYKALQPTAVTGIMVPCLMIYILILIPHTREEYRRLYNFAGHYVYANSEISSKHYVVCDRMAIDLLSSSLKTNILLIGSIQVSVSIPLYKMLYTDDDEMLVPVIVPFVDPKSTIGFYVNLVNQVTTAFVGGIAIPAIELVTCVLKNNVSATAAVIKNSTRELGDRLKSDGLFAYAHLLEFRNIILMSLDFDGFVIHFANLYYWKFFLQPIFIMYSATLTIALYFLDDWTCGVGGSFCAYVQLLILCDVGKIVVDANELVVDAFEQFPFYLLPAKKQEMLLFVLRRMQNGSKLRIGPLSELNYATATNLTKMIYTFVMMLLKAT